MNFLHKKSEFLAKKWVKMSFSDHNDYVKVVDNVENYSNMQFQPKVMTRSRKWAKTSFLEKIAYKNVQKWVKMSFADHGVKRLGPGTGKG